MLFILVRNWSSIFYIRRVIFELFSRTFIIIFWVFQNILKYEQHVFFNYHLILSFEYFEPTSKKPSQSMKTFPLKNNVRNYFTFIQPTYNTNIQLPFLSLFSRVPARKEWSMWNAFQTQISTLHNLNSGGKMRAIYFYCVALNIFFSIFPRGMPMLNWIRPNVAIWVSCGI